MAQSITKTFSTAGSSNVVIPSDVTLAQSNLWAGGGAGGGATGTKSAGGGGAGGAYVIQTVSISGGTTFPVVVGGGGVGGTILGPTGGSTWFSAVGTAYAPGGLGGTQSAGNNLGSQGGAGGTTGAIGTLAFAGGNGANGVGGTAVGALAGGGGGGASDTGVGENASGVTGGTGANTGGGHGGNGGGTAGAIGARGTVLGGGGGGAFSNNTTDRIGGTGAAGKASITYTTSDVDIVGSLLAFNVVVGPSGGTASYITSTFSNRALFAWVAIYEPVVSANRVIGTITYGGAGMTQIFNEVSLANDETRYLYYLSAPATGANNFIISLPGTVSDLTGMLTEAVNADSTQPDAYNIGTLTAVSAGTGTVTTVTDRSLVMDIIRSGNGGWSFSDTQSLIVKDTPNNYFVWAYHPITQTPAGAVTSVGTGALDSGGIYSIAVKQFVAPPAGTSLYTGFKTLLGVGA